MLATLIVGRKDGPGQQDSFSSLGFECALTFERGQPLGLAGGGGAFFLFNGLQSREGVPSGGVGGGGFAFGLLRPGAGLALRDVALGLQTGERLGGPAGLLLGRPSGGGSFGLLGLKPGEGASRLFRGPAGLLGGQPVRLGFGLGLTTGFGFALGEFRAFRFCPLGSQGVGGACAIRAEAKDRGDEKQDGENGDDDVLVHDAR